MSEAKDTYQDLYRKYRPTDWSGVVGQDEAVKVLRRMVKRNKVPHAILFSGGSGTGKTTLARILAAKIGCPEFTVDDDGKQRPNADFHEINCATVEEPLAMVRHLEQTMSLSTLSGGKARVWVLDEVASFSRSRFGLEATLKVLEEMPPHAYFMLCTTDPQKLLPAMRTRLTKIILKAVPVEPLTALVQEIAVKEKAEVSDQLAKLIAEAATGSAREAVQLLGSALALDSDEERLDLIRNSSGDKQGKTLARALMEYKANWPAVKEVLEKYEGDPDDIRRAVLGYARKVLLGGGKNAERAYGIIVVFESSFWSGGHASLARACYECFKGQGQR